MYIQSTFNQVRSFLIEGDRRYSFQAPHLSARPPRWYIISPPFTLLLGLTKGQRVPSATAVELWLGISTDEAIRIKPSRDRWIANRYPLIEAGMSRKDCMEWWKERYDRPLERSACVGCPYQSRQRWVETKRRWPGLFAEAVEIDSNMRSRLAFAKEPYLHPRRIPLDQAVSRDEAQQRHDGERDGFGNECEGHCGV